MVVSKETSYDVAYRISNKQGSLVGRIPHWENWLALAVAICTNKDAKQSLIAMGINPPNKEKGSCVCRRDIGYSRNYDNLAWVLNQVCGLTQPNVAKLLNKSESSIQRAVRRKRYRIE